MNKLKRFAAVLLSTTAVLQCFVSYVSAIGLGSVGYSGSREIVLIDISSETTETSDFVREFPKVLSLSELKPEPPVEEPAERATYDEIPNFTQESYPFSFYGRGTVASCGSSITAMAMVASYLTGYTYLPDELAKNFAGKADTDISRLSYAANALGLPFETLDKWQEIVEALKSGKIAILQVGVDSPFTDEEHFVVLKGITEEGKILVNDPCAANYENEMLKTGFEEGFAEGDVGTGALFAWVFDSSRIPEEIERYAEPTTDGAGERYKDLELTVVDKQLLARAVAILGYGECAEGQQAVVEVILNRLLSKDFPDDLKELIYGKNGLFNVELLNEVKLTAAEYIIVEKAIFGPYILAEDVTEFSYTCHN